MHALLDANSKRDIVFIEEIKPIATNELPVGQQQLNGCGTKHSQVAAHQGNALSCIAAAWFVQHHPHQWHTKPARYQSQHQNIDVL